MEKQSEQGSNNQQQQQLDSFAPLDGAAPDQDQIIGGGAGAEMVDYMLGQQTPPPPPPPHGHVSSFDKLSFSDVLHFADFGPRLALNQPLSTHHPADSDNDEDSYFFRFQPSLPAAEDSDDPTAQHAAVTTQGSGGDHGTVGGGVSESTTTLVQPQQQQQETVGGGKGGGGGGAGNKSGRRKRPRSTKTSEEVESQRMTHIAVERNRRRQMNDYLRVLRSLMPGSYVQRGDQASIIGGAIEFIRELEQLIQCLESQKRRRLYGDAPRPTAPDISTGAGAPPVVPPPATSSMLGADAVVKVLSRRRPEQLIKTIAVLEEMHLSILHTNITTIDQTVLYSFNVKIAGEPRFTAEDIAGAVHQILSFIDINYTL